VQLIAFARLAWLQKDGSTIEADLIIYATGFGSTRFLAPIAV
jgi:hypothetical protein